MTADSGSGETPPRVWPGNRVPTGRGGASRQITLEISRLVTKLLGE